MREAKEFRFNAILERSDNKLWGAHFEVPGDIAKRLISGKSRRVVCTLNGVSHYQFAMLPHGHGSLVISVNKKLREKLKLSFGSELDVRLKKDTSTYGLPVPEEFGELLRQDARGDTLFHALTRGKQRTILYMVGSPRSPEKRIERAVIVVNHLKANGGKINYRQLSASLKDPRHRSLRGAI